MSTQPTEQFYPGRALSAPKKRSSAQALNLLGGLLVLAGLLAWVWTYDYRWAATGILLGMALWLVAYRVESSGDLQ